MNVPLANGNNQIIFLLRQTENTSDRTSCVELSLPSPYLRLDSFVSEMYKSMMKVDSSGNVYKMDFVNELIFLGLLASIRSYGYHVFASNAYHDVQTNKVVKTFYFEESSDSDRSSIIRATNSMRLSPSKTRSSVIVPSSSSVRTSVDDKTMDKTTFMTKLKQEETDVQKRKENEERSMNEALLLQRRENEELAKQHETNKAAHYTRLGSAFLVSPDKRASLSLVRQSGPKK